MRVETGMPSIRKTALIALIAIVVLGTAVLAFRSGRWLSEFREMQKGWLSDSRFAQIRLALLNYHHDYGRFPPTRYQPKANGPTHSWRVLLLPYRDPFTRKLCSKYNFSEEWNSPGNLAVVQSLQPEMHVFSMNENNVANYLAIGDGDEWPSDTPLKAWVVTRGKDQFLLFEYPASSVKWAEPKY